MTVVAAEGTGYRWAGPQHSAAVDIFHTVRRMPYASTGRRTVEELIQDNRGACTAKHLLLRELLLSVGVPTTVETVAGQFGEGLPIDVSMSDELKTIIREGGVRDYHHYVTAHFDGKPISLDATWHDALIPLGFAVNNAWNGIGDTVIALRGVRLDDKPEDLGAYKAAKIAELPPSEQTRRQEFLRLLTDWISGLNPRS